MMYHMDSKDVSWDKRSIEIPPGWHEAMHKLSDLTGVGLKYLYTLALDRLLSDDGFETIEEAGSSLQRRSKKDLTTVSECHTAQSIESRFEKSSARSRGAKSRRGKR